jgi:ribosomal protection tetracycline resistance protein
MRVEPGARGSGITYRLEVELGALPLSYHRAIEETARAALEQGLHGWPVTDVVLTLTDTWYDSGGTVAGDFRAVAPYVTLQALADAGTRVFEPCHAFTLDVPADRIGPVLARLAQLGATIDGSTVGGSVASGGTEWRVEGSMPARVVPGFTQELPGLSGGDGAWLSRPEGDRAVAGRPPERSRTDGNPVDRDAYILHLSRGVAVG